MLDDHLPLRRALGLYPYGNRVAFAIVEHPIRWIDSGSRHVAARPEKAFSDVVQELIEKNSVSVLAVEADDHYGRGAIAMRRINTAMGIARLLAVDVVMVDHGMVRRAVGTDPSASRHAVAILLHGQFPQLGARIPRKRRPWETESGKSRVYRALGIALAGVLYSGAK